MDSNEHVGRESIFLLQSFKRQYSRYFLRNRINSTNVVPFDVHFHYIDNAFMPQNK